MLLCRLTFDFKREVLDQNEREDLTELALSYMVTLLKEGRIWGRDYQYAWQEDRLLFYFYLPTAEDFQWDHPNEASRKSAHKLAENLCRPPEFQVVGQRQEPPEMHWRDAASLVLCTDFIDYRSPLKHGETGMPIPLAWLPIHHFKKDNIFLWAAEYRAHDKVFIGSGELELPAYKQMADPASSLCQIGRGLCTLIEEHTEIPTFFYLYKYWGYPDQREWVCPSCGGPFQVAGRESVVGHFSGEIAEPPSFWDFPFRCLPCRLVSQTPVDVDGRRAHIGTFPGSRSKKA